MYQCDALGGRRGNPGDSDRGCLTHPGEYDRLWLPGEGRWGFLTLDFNRNPLTHPRGSDRKCLREGGDSDSPNFFCQNPLGQPLLPPLVRHIDTCISPGPYYRRAWKLLATKNDQKNNLKKKEVIFVLLSQNFFFLVFVNKKCIIAKFWAAHSGWSDPCPFYDIWGYLIIFTFLAKVGAQYHPLILVGFASSLF